MHFGNRLDGIECSWARSIGMPVTRVDCTCEASQWPTRNASWYIRRWLLNMPRKQLVLDRPFMGPSVDPYMLNDFGFRL